VKTVSQFLQLAPQMPVWGLTLLPAGGPSLPLSLAAIAGTSGTLVAWRKLPRHRAKLESALPVSAYARHFDLREQEIEDGRRAMVSVVHHHSDGRISHIECHPPSTDRDPPRV
jgi:poly-beta-1,6-N-acetyl-D-glucosamine biosynthesis protein PgaD